MTMTSELRVQALQVAAAIDPEVMTGDQAALVVEDLAVAEKALGGTLMFAALRVAHTDAWRGKGHQTAADWLAATTGISVYEANRQLGTAKKAERLPKTKEAMKRGDLSPAQADAVTDAATADPSAEDDLLATAARDTHKHLREEAARRKAAATDSALREKRIHAERSLRRFTDSEGAYNVRWRGPATDGVRFEAMLRPFEEQAFRTGRRDGVRDTFDNRTYDAAMALLGIRPLGGEEAASPASGTRAEAPPQPDPGDPTASTSAPDQGPQPEARANDGQPEAPSPPDPSGRPGPNPGDRTTPPASPVMSDRTRPSPGASPEPAEPDPWAGHPSCPSTAEQPSSPDGGTAIPTSTTAAPVRRPPGGNNVKIIVRIDHAALARGHTIAGETCDVAGVGPISVAAAKELMGDAFLAAVITKGRDVINVAHLGRGLNAHQRTAIEAMGLRCSNVACNRTIALQVDHRVPYADDPVTALDNQDPLCPECHRLKTHHGHHLEPGRGPRRLLPPGSSRSPRSDGSGSRAEQIEQVEQVEQPTLC